MKEITVTAKAAVTPSATIQQSSATKQFATFKVGPLFLGIELASIQELLRCQEMAMVPLAPVAVVGLINLRGQIVTALDMRKICGLAPLGKDASPPMNIVVHGEGGPVSLLVDEICDVIDVPLITADKAFTELPENLPSEQKALLTGVHQLESCLLLIVNTERVIQAGAL